MNRARFALGIAYPSFIQMSFRQGFLDLGFKLEGVIRQEFNLRGIPITPFIPAIPINDQLVFDRKKELHK